MIDYSAKTRPPKGQKGAGGGGNNKQQTKYNKL